MDKIGVKKPEIDLTPLDGHDYGTCFRLEIDKFAAKSLNGKEITVGLGSTQLKHIIAYEGNAYTVEVNFCPEAIKAVY